MYIAEFTLEIKVNLGSSSCLHAYMFISLQAT